ncbi:hypothetical protein [Aneurinibacillus sp. REN35]
MILSGITVILLLVGLAALTPHSVTTERRLALLKENPYTITNQQPYS